MFKFRNNRKLWVGAAGTGILLVAGILAVVIRKNHKAAQAQPPCETGRCDAQESHDANASKHLQ